MTSAPASPVTPAHSPAAPSTFGEPLMFSPDAGEWKPLKAIIPAGLSAEDEKKLHAAVKATRDELKAFLLSSLQMQHVVVLAGSGTSLGSITKGPSMWDLWDHCVHSNPGTGTDARTISTKAAKVIKRVGYDVAAEKENIESLLSRCEAVLQIEETAYVRAFVTASRKLIVDMCAGFLNPSDDSQLAGHRTFLHRLSRRRVRDSRLKLFTTNYDTCFEMAAGRQGLVVMDGFSFTQPRRFDPRFFLHDIVRRPSTADDIGIPLEGVFHLFKLHGSVNWSRESEHEIQVSEKPAPDKACLIYPARGKYQQSYVQPHLELMSQYLSALREPNTCLIVTGFGFNDDHLSEPILAAITTNPHMRLIVADPAADDITASRKPRNRYWEAVFQLAKQGEDVKLINASFGDFADLIPDLKSLTPAQRLTRDIKGIVGGA